MTILTHITASSTSIFHGALSWDAVERIADRRCNALAARPEHEICYRAASRMCDLCRSASGLRLAIIFWRAEDDAAGVPRSMGAAAAAHISPRLPMRSFRPRLVLLRGGGWSRLGRGMRLACEASASYAPASDWSTVTSSGEAPHVTIVNRRNVLAGVTL